MCVQNVWSSIGFWNQRKKKCHKGICDIWENLCIDTNSVKFLGCEKGIVVMQGNVPVCRRSMMKRCLGSEKSAIYFPVVQGKKYIYR